MNAETPPLGPACHHGPVPLSYSQERMWLIQSLAPESTAYNVAVGLRFRGPLDVGALSEALNKLCRRHETLRCTVRMVNGQPLQYFEPWEERALTVLDLRDRGENAGTEALEQAGKEASTPFDLARGPVIRTKLFQTDREEHLLMLVLHHIAGDQWSIGVLGREMAELYNGLRKGIQPRLEPLPISFVNYAVRQRSGHVGEESESQMSFWRRQLADLPSLELPADRQRPRLPRLHGAVCRMPIPAPLMRSLAQLDRGIDGTLFITTLSAFAALLHRITGQEDIPIGVPVANRGGGATEGLVGSLVNILVLRIDLAGNPEFRELMRRTRVTALDAFAHQDVSFDRLVQELGQHRDASRAPLTQVLFDVANAPMDDIRFDDLVWEPVILDRGGAQFELNLSVDADVTQSVALEYDTDLFDSATIERLIRQYFMILESAAAAPGAHLGTLPLLPAGELATLSDWNATSAPYPRNKIFSRIFEQRVALSPDATAVTFEGASMTYAELNAHANVVGHHLRALGVGPGVLVGLCLNRSLDLLVALLGIQKSGGAYVPLDPEFPAERLEYMLSDSGAKVLVTAGTAARGLDLPDGIRILDLETAPETPESVIAANLEEGAGPEDAAYVIYTSGSTGRPKGVVVSHRALLNFLWSMRQRPGLGASDVLAAVTTISFDIVALELYLPLIAGARILLVSRETGADGMALSQLLASSGASVLQATPTKWRMLLEAGWTGRKGFRALCGGEPLPRDLADSILGCVDELWNLYGPTETTVWSTTDLVARGATAISVGRPIGNTQVHILDSAGELVPIGNPGEICIGGEGLAIGYHGRPELTSQYFVPDRFSEQPKARLYRTGDLGCWGADGKLYHLGRLDHQLKIRGVRIEPGEIESVLRGHEAVRQAVVVAGEARPGDQRLVAYVVYRHGEDLTVSDMRRYLRKQFPDFMIPSMIVALDALPLTANGKVDRNALPDPFRNALRVIASHDPPSPGMEQTMAEIWQSVLMVDRIDASDNFFEIGGHSLLSLRVAQEVEKRTGFRMDPRALFFNDLRQVVALVVSEAKNSSGGR